MAFQWYTFLLLNPVWNIVNSFSEMQRSLAAMERVFEVLGWKTTSPTAPMPWTRHASCAKCASITFRSNIARGIRSCTISTSPCRRIGYRTGGRSGAGKTTVTDLVARFHDPTRAPPAQWRDIREFRLKSYRGLLAIVQQEFFCSTARCARTSPTAARRHGRRDRRRGRRANAHEFIVKLPQQYETFIGERGVKLSGGQRSGSRSPARFSPHRKS
jgi:ATP-binding cassette subfamily B protein/subfamily B ATP-binding cassette protein MsbA